MAGYAERKIEGGPLSPAMELSARHERLCEDCREECAALTAALMAGDDAP